VGAETNEREKNERYVRQQGGSDKEDEIYVREYNEPEVFA
jgi:hypothetical protein